MHLQRHHPEDLGARRVSAQRKSIALATAALQDIISKGKAMGACAMREDGAAPRDALRNDAHALLDAYLDHMADAGLHALDHIPD